VLSQIAQADPPPELPEVLLREALAALAPGSGDGRGGSGHVTRNDVLSNIITLSVLGDEERLLLVDSLLLGHAAAARNAGLSEDASRSRVAAAVRRVLGERY
jgi:hypothetical protein